MDGLLSLFYPFRTRPSRPAHRSGPRTSTARSTTHPAPAHRRHQRSRTHSLTLKPLPAPPLSSISTPSVPTDPSKGVVCSICLIAPVTIILIPCGHITACGGCMHRMESCHGKGLACPVCRARVHGVFGFFVAGAAFEEEDAQLGEVEGRCN